ncbi:hypothetical protein NQD34_004004 [Periophthalmus magnuspinnatus]|nr:hypothetical protein NQD34_004004 [Periophthalmus magnuspinnatus]
MGADSSGWPSHSPGTEWLRLRNLEIRKINYIQLKIDFEQELIKLCSTEPTEIKDLPSRIPKDVARYHFFLYKHSHEGDYLESTVFIYSMPGYKCSIREDALLQLQKPFGRHGGKSPQDGD